MSGWDYEKRAAEVEVERAAISAALILQKSEQNRPLVKAELNDVQATSTQLELFDLVGRDSYDYVEALIRRLPSKRQREHFRHLYLREYHAVEDDGSISFLIGNKQRTHANHFLRELLETRLGKVFSQYQYDLEWLSFSIAEKWGWVLEQSVKYREQIEASDMLLRERENDAVKQKLPFYLMTESKLSVVAGHLSTILAKLQTDFFTERANSGEQFSDKECNDLLVTLYRRIGSLCETIGLPIRYWATFSFHDGDEDFCPNLKSIEIALNKAACDKFWLKQLKKAQKQMVEHLAIACGDVRKDVAAYISEHGFNAWKAQRKKNFDFLRSQILINLDNEEEQAELLDMYLKSSANPSIRHQEMMACLNGIEVWANENNHQALFLTLTAPSAYHAQHSEGGQNKKWNGSSPKQTQAYLNKVWAQYRALLKKRSISFYGMRVAEPHHDGTPHWHLLMYVAKEHVEEVSRLFKQKALEVDGDEAGAKKHRCKVELCDPNKGSATAYIVKYISKNLGGLGDVGYLSDEVEGLGFKDNAGRVRAWASMWGIRQFQFYGVASVGVWRELRRLTAGQIADPALEELRLGADLGDYAFYLDKQGGGGATRDLWRAKLAYEETEENRYGEVGKRIIGIKSEKEEVKSRLKRWQIVPKKAVKTVERSETANTGHSPAWTCVSNCNPRNIKGSANGTSGKLANYFAENAERLERFRQALKMRGIVESLFSETHIFSLLNGGEVKIYGKDYITFDGNEVQIARKH
ncbi:replication protein [Mannheimia granulomatis]|uniref:Replication protein n=1 Tax=Mannheimia granulomatis TaxID=85402 RepID=A0A011MGM1_9PAST|nr:replication endonuclease [Mannheimia granulomatis]EXI61651.1 replication protein [Mannheimia granulomatis]RGE48280.1 replication protein [Mannheimia granulomatis]